MTLLAVRVGVGVGALSCALALSACTNGAAPIVTETPSPTVSATPSPSLSASPPPLTDEELLALLPPDAEYPDARGAMATAQFFLEEFNRIYLTGDMRVWEALSGSSCMFCTSAREEALELHSEGGYRDGGDLSFDEALTVVNYFEETGFWYVTFSVSWTPTNDHFPDGSVIPDGDGGSANISLEMDLQDGIWHVLGVGVEET